MRRRSMQWRTRVYLGMERRWAIVLVTLWRWRWAISWLKVISFIYNSDFDMKQTTCSCCMSHVSYDIISYISIAIIFKLKKLFIIHFYLFYIFYLILLFRTSLHKIKYLNLQHNLCLFRTLVYGFLPSELWTLETKYCRHYPDLGFNWQLKAHHMPK